MSYCSKCGKLLKGIENFCDDCGARIGEAVGDIREETKEVIEKTSHKGLIIFIIFLIIIGYAVLDLWAISQLTPVISGASILASVSNFNADTSLSKSSVSSSIRMENPTFVPILFGRISYDANYGDTKIADGKTGFFIIGPSSQKDIPVDLTINHVNTLMSGGKFIWNTLTGKKEKLNANVYADFEIAKFKIGTIE